MTLPPEAEGMSDINITPLTDVLLVLLIIFLCTATSANENAFNMNLPLGSAAATVNVANDVVVVSMDLHGKIYLQEEKTPVLNPETELVQRLQLYQQKKGTDKVAIRADGKVEYGKVVKVMDASKQAGLEKIVLVAN
ncbi:biopolymer transporter ExbD [bacterium]|nr:biopolymer transporter ExbD [bacterium]